MAGAELVVEIDIREMDTALHGLRKLSANWAPMMERIGVELAANTRNRFPTGMDPEGNAWKPLLPAYAAVKEGPSILIGLGMQGGLQGSIVSEANSEQVAIGTSKVYGAAIQFGATIKPKDARALVFRMATGMVFAKQVTLPARAYLGFSDQDRATTVQVADLFLQRAMAGSL